MEETKSASVLVPTSRAPLPMSSAERSDQDPLFTEFWAAYPRKVGKGHARRAWRSAQRSGAQPQHIIAAAERFRDECFARGTPKEYIPHPVTWLSGERFADEPHQPVEAAAAPAAAVTPMLPSSRPNHEQLLATVIRLSSDQEHPVTAAAAIIEAVRFSLASSEGDDTVVVSLERGRELAAMPYQEYLETPEWQERRRAALKRAGNRCQVCNRSRTLHVHHRTYERRGIELPSDLTVLCDECHSLYHGKGLLAPHDGNAA